MQQCPYLATLTRKNENLRKRITSLEETKGPSPMRPFFGGLLYVRVMLFQFCCSSVHITCSVICTVLF